MNDLYDIGSEKIKIKQFEKCDPIYVKNRKNKHQKTQNKETMNVYRLKC